MLADIPDKELKSRLVAPRTVQDYGIDETALVIKLGLDGFNSDTDHLSMGRAARGVCLIDDLPFSKSENARQ